MLLRFPPWKVVLVLGTLLIGALCALPNALTEQQRAQYLGWFPVKPLNLGPKAGKWAISANVQYYHLANDNLRLVKSAINRGDNDRDQLQFGIALNVGF